MQNHKEVKSKIWQGKIKIYVFKPEILHIDARVIESDKLRGVYLNYSS